MIDETRSPKVRCASRRGEVLIQRDGILVIQTKCDQRRIRRELPREADLYLHVTRELARDNKGDSTRNDGA